MQLAATVASWMVGLDVKTIRRFHVEEERARPTHSQTAADQWKHDFNDNMFAWHHLNEGEKKNKQKQTCFGV